MEQHNETPHREEKGGTVSVVVILSSHTQWSGYKHREGASDLEKTSEKEQGSQGSLQGRDDTDWLWDSSCLKRKGELRGVEGQQRRGRIHELQVAVEFKDCLSPDILITPIMRMRSFCLEG